MERANSNQQQLELWNSSIQPWRPQMERDAFAIAFPGETLGELDRVDVFMNFIEASDGYAYSEWTFDPETDAQFMIEVRWFEGNNRSKLNPKNVRPLRHHLKAKKTHEKQDALKFWLELMRRGSGG